MAGGPSVAILRDIQTLFDTGTASGLSDRQLLERFSRHGTRRPRRPSRSWSCAMDRWCCGFAATCSATATDAQDAFQATFLVLVKRSGSIRRLESLGSWLYGVACRVAARARVEASPAPGGRTTGALRVVQAVDSSADGRARHVPTSARSFRRKSGGCRRSIARWWCSATGRG